MPRRSATTAIALRPRVSVGVSAALAEIGTSPALAALAANTGSDIAETSLARIVARHGDCAKVREALLSRPDLPLPIRQAVAVALSDALSSFVLDKGWLSRERTTRMAREAREKTTVALSSAAEEADVRNLVVHLRRTGQLTPGLILRALLSRATAFVEAAFADLSGMPAARVAGLLWDRRGSGLAPLYHRAGLPVALKPAFDAAFAALGETLRTETVAEGAQLSRRMIERVLTACESLPAEEAGKLVALLRRYEAEAAREEARELAGALADEAALAAVLEHMPQVGERLLDAA